MNALLHRQRYQWLLLLLFTLPCIASSTISENDDVSIRTRRLGSLLSTSTRRLQSEINGIDNTVMKEEIAPPILLAPLPVAAPVLKVAEPYTLRINAGSTEDYIDTDGFTWKSDAAFTNTGDIYSVCPLEIVNTTLDTLYCKERYFNKWVHINKSFKYNIPVPPKLPYSLGGRFNLDEINNPKTENQPSLDIILPPDLPKQ